MFLFSDYIPYWNKVFGKINWGIQKGAQVSKAVSKPFLTQCVDRVRNVEHPVQQGCPNIPTRLNVIRKPWARNTQGVQNKLPNLLQPIPRLVIAVRDL